MRRYFDVACPDFAQERAGRRDVGGKCGSWVEGVKASVGDSLILDLLGVIGQGRFKKFLRIGKFSVHFGDAWAPEPARYLSDEEIGLDQDKKAQLARCGEAFTMPE
ncbi:MAG: hypothetical protein JSV99_05630 [Planctomycetota bacterium]|nr:MAG: hypothetical protein JSV99_05630 [Planctomycetota bacterium]